MHRKSPEELHQRAIVQQIVSRTLEFSSHPHANTLRSVPFFRALCAGMQTNPFGDPKCFGGVLWIFRDIYGMVLHGIFQYMGSTGYPLHGVMFCTYD